MAERATPYTQSFDLASLGDGEKIVELTPSAADRAAIAKWASVDALDKFSATVRLRRTAQDSYRYEGTFAADVTQSCVVTLDPVPAHLEGTVERDYRVVPQRARRHAKADEELEDAGSDDETETLASSVLDVALPVLEEFALTIDPYPRAPGAVFDSPTDSDKPANPFGALAKLKDKG